MLDLPTHIAVVASASNAANMAAQSSSQDCDKVCGFDKITEILKLSVTDHDKLVLIKHQIAISVAAQGGSLTATIIFFIMLAVIGYCAYVVISY